MNKTIVSGAVIIGILGFANIGMAAQRMITEQSLDSAYKTQISSLDKQIIDTQMQINNTLENKGAAIGKIQPFTSNKSQEKSTIDLGSAKTQLETLKHQEDIIKITYQFMKASLQ